MAFKEVITQRRHESLIDKSGKPTHRFIRFLEELTDNSNKFINALTGFYEFDDLEKIDVTQAIRKNVTLTSIDYTTNYSEVIICDNANPDIAINVFLNEQPEDQELVTVKITNGDVTVNAGSRLVDKQDFITVDFSEIEGLATLDIIYIIEKNEWFII